MKRVALLAGLVAAVVVPTALIVSAPAAQAKPQFYSAQQVLRVFEAEGILLHRAPDDAPYTHRETFTGPAAQLSVDVLHGAAPEIQAFAASCQGSFLPAILSRGNVEIEWCGGSRSENLRINAAADDLRYSPEDASLRPPPTFVLRVGRSRTIDLATTPAAAVVDCVNGAATASQPLHPRMRASQIEVAEPADAAGSTNTDYAFLSWHPLAGSLVRFSCHSY